MYIMRWVMPRILIAEDDLTSRVMLEAILNKWQYETIVTQDGESAWEVMQKPDAPELIILDWNMPKLDGLEVCRRIRQMETEQPSYIILLTSREQKGDIVIGLNAGANDYITKPYDQDELRARIAVGIRMVSLQHDLAKRIHELQEALSHVRKLQGILPICAYCKKIRDDKQYWRQVESYISEHAEVRFTHGICPTCLEKQLAELNQKDGC